MALILLRHTTPQVLPGTCYGQLDLPLADTFETEAQSVLETVPEISTIIASPLIRCRTLAERIAQDRALSVTLEPRIIEMDFGSWEGKTWSDIPRPELDQWAGDFMHARPHGGESVAMLTARVQACLQDLTTHSDPVLVVTHAGVIKAARATDATADSYATQIEFGGMVTLP